ncbi:hypothetical protein [Natrarchaeobius oligotrophus]|nr:hypothetical protein [Natrarchaeobius chitinivorans]
MAAPTPPPRTSPTNDAVEPGVGIAHPTVVPTNFESDEGAED